MYFKKFLFLSAVIVTVTSYFCVRDVQFREYCITIECCDDYECIWHGCSKVCTQDVKLIKIKEAKIIPSCAFSGNGQPKHIYAVNANIHSIASRAFTNMRNLESIILSFNHIRELHSGIFKNVSVLSLDLSWNRIIYIQKDAFKGINGLKYLNLSTNELTTVPVQRLPSSLIELNLSHNLFTSMVLNYIRYPKLTNIDLSHNVLERVALLFETTVKKIDLANNNLKDIDFFEVDYCEKLKIPSNKFSEVPKFLTYSNITHVSLYPNPWRCEELHNLWTHLQNNAVGVEEKPSHMENIPICIAKARGLLSSPAAFSGLNENSKNCNDDSQCDTNMVCRGTKCRDPCKENVCDSGSICQVSSHKYRCSCPQNLRRDPRDIYSPCVKAECFFNIDCNLGFYCSSRTCQMMPKVMGAGSTPNVYTIAPAEEVIPWWFHEIPRLPRSLPSKN